MKTYHEKTGELIENPDLKAGYIYPVRRQIGTKRVTLERTVELYPPNGLQHEEPVYEDCQIYVPYTEEELAAQNNPEQSADLDTRVTALETGQADLQEALDLLLSGVTE